MFVQGRTAHAARRLRLAEGEVVGIEQSQRFADALAQVGAIGLEGLGAADVHVPQVEWRFAIVHPLRQRHAGAAADWMPMEL